MTFDPYVDASTGVLRNHLGITDSQTLAQADADLSLAALADLGVRILPGDYDLPHLQSFHREIFADLYPWAGEIRTVAIARTEPFCLPQHIQSFAARHAAGVLRAACTAGRLGHRLVQAGSRTKRGSLDGGSAGRRRAIEGDVR